MDAVAAGGDTFALHRSTEPYFIVVRTAGVEARGELLVTRSTINVGPEPPAPQAPS